MSRLRLVGEGEGAGAHTHAEADISDGTILARLAASEAITGAWDFSTGKIRLAQGLDANKPATGNSEGHIYWATDTDKLYVWDGAAWREVSFRSHAASHGAGGSDLVAAGRLRTGTDAGKPATGNTEGDVWWATDTDKLFVWDGAAWKEMAGGELSMPFRYRRSVRWYGPSSHVSSLAGITAAANTLYAQPLFVPVSLAVDRLGIYINVAAGGNARLGIYNEGGSVYPTALLLDAGEVATGTTGEKAIIISQTLSPGLYWLVCLFSAAPGVAVEPPAQVIFGQANMDAVDPQGRLEHSQTYGLLPATFPSATPVFARDPIHMGVRKA